jgi:hypothetical protein
VAAGTRGRRLRLRSLWIRVMGPVSRRRLPLGVGLCLGLDSLSLRQLVLLRRLRLGMGAGGRLRSFRLGIHRGWPARQHRCVSRRLPADSSSGSRSWPGAAAHPGSYQRHIQTYRQAGAAGGTPDRWPNRHADCSASCQFKLWRRSHGFLFAPRLSRGFHDPRPCPWACRHAAGGRLYRPGIAVLRSSSTGFQSGDASQQARARNFIQRTSPSGGGHSCRAAGSADAMAAAAQRSGPAQLGSASRASHVFSSTIAAPVHATAGPSPLPATATTGSSLLPAAASVERACPWPQVAAGLGSV